MKATYVEVNGEGRPIFKNPVTDDGTKKSAYGLLKVLPTEGGYELVDNVTWDEEKNDSSLVTLYENGEFKNTQTLEQIRETLKTQNAEVEIPAEV